MTVALFDTAQIGDIADAIRTKTGKTGTMTVGEMPAEIAGIGADYEEIMLATVPNITSAVAIDTGVAPSLAYSFEVSGFIQQGSMGSLLNAYTSGTQRQGASILTVSNKLQLHWGSANNTSVFVPASVIKLSETFTYTQNSGGITLMQRGRYYSFDLTGQGSAPTETYKLFAYAGNADMKAGVLNYVKIFDADKKLLHHFVPIKTKTGVLQILDKVTDNRLTVPDSFIEYTGG